MVIVAQCVKSLVCVLRPYLVAQILSLSLFAVPMWQAHAQDLVAFYRFRSPDDRLLTPSCEEKLKIAAAGYYSYEGVIGQISTTGGDGKIELFRGYNGNHHLYSTSKEEVSKSPFHLEGSVGFLSATQVAGTLPLLRLYRDGDGDHFFTSSNAEANDAAANGNYKIEGVIGYVWSNTADTCPIPKPRDIHCVCHYNPGTGTVVHKQQCVAPSGNPYSQCVEAFRGGDCPFDLDQRYSIAFEVNNLACPPH